jgi:hypothetical protein
MHFVFEVGLFWCCNAILSLILMFIIKESGSPLCKRTIYMSPNSKINFHPFRNNYD